MKKINKFLLLLISVSILITGCSDKTKKKSQSNTSLPDSSSVVTTDPTPKVPEPDPVVRVVAVGDNLIHDGIYNQAHQRAKDGTYDFDYAYQYVEGLIKPADIAILNQETPIANDLFPPSNYPMFNSPTQLGDKMIDMGFNVISHSNNHVLDKGEKGMLATLDYWDSRNIMYYGAYRNQADLDKIRIKEVNGITFSFVGFMEHTNGLKLPANSEAKLVYTSQVDEMERLIKKARSASDVVVVSVHWGVETINQVTDAQKNLGKKFVEWGADIIIGTQPHTIQTMEYIEKPDGGKAFVTYSLGNFISAQSYNLTMVGGLIDLNVRKELSTGKIYIEDVKCIPIITHYDSGYRNIRSYPYSMYSQELANQHGIKSTGQWFDMKFIDKLVTENIPEEFRYLN